MISRLPLILSMLLAVCADAADLAREARVRERIESGLHGGEATMLQTADTRFLAILAPARTPVTQGAVILAHDQGAHPDWPEVIRPLRTGLPDHGWQTLALQMPLASADARTGEYENLVPEAGRRLAFAAEFLAQQNIRNIAVIGHGLGARMALEWLAQDAPEAVKALVVVGLETDPELPDSGALDALSRLQLPLLDLYGSRDPGASEAAAEARAAAALRAGNGKYRALEIEGADHDFHALDTLLIARVRAWLHRVAGGTERPLRRP